MPSNLTTLTTPNAILHVSEQDESTLKSGVTAGQSPSPQVLIFFITGNPGLISYYEEFLKLIAAPYLQHSTWTDNTGKRDEEHHVGDVLQTSVIVAGFSLGGFEILPAAQSSQPSSHSTFKDTRPRSLHSEQGTGNLLLEESLLYPPGSKRKTDDEIYSLREQIELCYARLEHLVSLMTSDEDAAASPPVLSSTSDSQRPVNVILIGHSVGAHIALEMTRIHHSRYFTSTNTTMTTKIAPSFAIRSSILLTPTILNIAHSPSGLIATPLLTYIPFLPGLMQLLASSLTSIIYSRSWLSWLIGRVTGMEVGSKALETTVAFLRTRGAVRQALAMAADEMREIAGDVWKGRNDNDEVDLWGLEQMIEKAMGDGDSGSQSHSASSVPKSIIDAALSDSLSARATWIPPRLFLLFAKTDHWVAEATRSEILAALVPNDDAERNEIKPKSIVTGTQTSPASPSGKSRTTPVAVVDESEGLVHAWCLRQSALVAERVRGWIAEILDEM